jgi:hypothetical protein
VATAVAETYLQHAVPDQQDIDIEEGLLHVGRLIEKIKTCNEIEFNMYYDNSGFDYSTEYEAAMLDLDDTLHSLPEPDRLDYINYSKCTPDVFLEVRMGNIRNALLSFQGWLQKIKLARTNSIIVSLNLL